jgi:hypothetical protein
MDFIFRVGKGCNGRRHDEVDVAMHEKEQHNAPVTWLRCIVSNCSYVVLCREIGI